MFRRSTSRPVLARATKPIIESLENRTLLTTLHGQDVLEFKDPNENIIRVALNGAVTDTAEIIGASVDETNTAILHNFSGTINGVNVRGGIGGKLGVIEIGDTVQTGLLALATNSAGDTYAFNILTPPQPANGVASKIVQLLSVDTTTGVASLSHDITAGLTFDPNTADDNPTGEVPLSTVTGITAADFDPTNDNILYFVATDETPAFNAGGGGGGGGTGNTVTRLYSVDVTTGTVTAHGAFGTDSGDEAAAINIASISFNSAGQLWAFYTTENGDHGFIAQISKTANNGAPNGAQVRLDGEDVTDITGIEFLPLDSDLTNSDPANSVIDGGGDGFLFAVTGGTPGDPTTGSTDAAGTDAAQLLHINMNFITLQDGTRVALATSVGGLTSYTANSNAGKNLQGIAFDPTLENPFYDGSSGSTPLGTLLGVDVSTHQLVAIDTRARYEFSTVYNIYVTSSTSDTSISVAKVPPPGPGERNMLPFEGNITMRVQNPTDPATTILVSSNEGTGVALLGAQTRDIDPDDADEDQIPLLTATLAAGLGVAPAGDYVPGLIVTAGNNLGRFTFGGTVTGAVDVEGSLDLFYAGWLVTGDSDAGINPPSVPDTDFFVNGDLGALLVMDSIGTDEVSGGETDYNPGTNIEVGGKLGHMQTGESSLASVVVDNAGTGDPNAPIKEFETRFGPGFDGSGLLTAFAYNDTLDNPQYLRTIGPDDPTGYIEVDAFYELDADGHPEPADTFAAGLMSGQTYTVACNFSVYVYDPDGRLIASSDSHLQTNYGQPFKFTANLPGVYKFEVRANPPLPSSYSLYIRGVGGVALGGLVAAGDISGNINVENADLGAIVSGGSLAYGGTGFVNVSDGSVFLFGYEIDVDNGNIRSVSAAQIGTSIGDDNKGPNLFASGSVGRVHSEGLAAVLVNAGDDIQMVDVLGDAYLQLDAGAAIGVVRAGTLTSGPSVFRANSDNTGFDGIIGLIESGGDLGSFIAGGPQIATGQGGNVRYITAPGRVYQDSFFGGGTIPGTRGEVVYDPGEVVSLTDDSGAAMTFTPIGPVTTNPNYDPTITDPDIDNPQTFGPQVSVIPYAIEGSGGVVIINATLAGIGGQGMTISGSADAANMSVDIAKIELAESATALTLDANGLPVYPGAQRTQTNRKKGPLQLDENGNAIRPDRSSGKGPLVLDDDGNANGNTISSVTVGSFGTDSAPVVIDLTGSAMVNVLDTTGTNLTRITNDTGGEMPIIQADSVGEIVSNADIGVATSIAGVSVAPAAVLKDTYPFQGLHTGVIVNNVASIRSTKSIGNLSVGAVNEVIANSDATDDPSEVEGITGPILADGNIGFVQIGEALMPSGSGLLLANSGIFSNGIIYQISGQNGANIYGDIVAAERIGAINLNNGSIINSDIAVSQDFQQVSVDIPLEDSGLLTGVIGSRHRVPLLGSITISGNGGIIGTFIDSTDIGTISAAGFIFNTAFLSGGQGNYGKITAGGYGIREMNILSAGNVGTISATGNGSNLSVASFPTSLRYSETQPLDSFFLTGFDPILGTPPSTLSDINAILGTSASVPVIDGVTDTGVIQNVEAIGALSLNLVSANQIRSTTVVYNASATSTLFSFGVSIGEIRTTGLINGLTFTTGRLGKFNPGTDVYGLNGTVAGPIGLIRMAGTLGDDSQINAIGRNGVISRIDIGGDLDGTIHASSRIGTITVHGVVTGSIVVDNLSGRVNIGLLNAMSGIGQDNLVITGSIGRIIIGAGSALGTPGGTLTVNGNLNSLMVMGGVLDSNLIVNGDMSLLYIKGTLAGDVTVSGDVNRIYVANAEGTATDSVKGDINVSGDLRSFAIAGGNLSGNVNVGGNLTVFSQSRGGLTSVDPAATPASFTVGEMIRTLSTTGSVDANLAAASFGNVTIRGDLGDGVDAITTTALSMNLLYVFGSIKSGSTTTVNGTIRSLIVRGDVEAGAVVTAATITRKRIFGAVAGTVTP